MTAKTGGPVRDVQLSIIDGHERNVGPVPLSVFHGSNADLIAKVAPLYLTGTVLDVTYGLGNWWTRFRPPLFVAHDLKLDGVDFRSLPEVEDSFDAVCFDPPYVPAGGTRTAGQTVAEKRYRDGFGLDPRSRTELDALIAGGLGEVARVSRRWVLVKCCDYVTGGRLVLGHLTVATVAEGLGLRVHDLIVHASGTGPGGHNITEIKRARRAHSYLFVFTKREGNPPVAGGFIARGPEEADG